MADPVWYKATMIDDLDPFFKGEVVWIKRNIERPSSMKTWWLLSTEAPGYLYNVADSLIDSITRTKTVNRYAVEPTEKQLAVIQATFKKLWRQLKKTSPDTLWKVFEYRSDTAISFKQQEFRLERGMIVSLNKVGEQYYLTNKALGRDKKFKIKSDTAKRIIERSKLVREILLPL